MEDKEWFWICCAEGNQEDSVATGCTTREETTENRNKEADSSFLHQNIMQRASYPFTKR